MALKISEEAAVQMPMKTVASLICLVAIGTWAFFSIQETLNRHTTTLELMSKDLEQNSEFRIKYPRGEMGQSSGEAELFMLVEHMSGQLEKIIEKQENSMHNKVNIDRLQKDVEKILEDIENLKDKVRNNGTGVQ
jgi:uncharacterized membrane protein YraQ (UPF0718 family)